MSFVKQLDGSYAEAGKESSIVSGKVVDDTKDFGVQVIKCVDYLTESYCTAAGCYWYNNACHSKPEVPEVPEIPIAVILAAVGGVVVIIGLALVIRR